MSDICYYRSIVHAHPLAKRLNRLLEEGKIPQDCIYYKFLENTSAFALIDSKSLSDFKWDKDLCEFYDTINYLGGQRTCNFICGPGFIGTGQGGVKRFDTFADFNLGGPSSNVSKHSQAGYTTRSGIIKPHLQSFLKISKDLSSKAECIIDNELVQVIPAAAAMDRTALKPGLEFDTRGKCVVGMLEDVSLEYVKAHPVPSASEVKNNLVTSANVLHVSAMDNRASMPVGVYYLPKCVSGEQIFNIIQEAVEAIQICERCLSQQRSTQHIISHRDSTCSSICEHCLENSEVC